MRRLLIIASLLATLFVVAGCNATHGSSQATSVNTTGADVSQLPGGFRNFADKCDGHGHRVYVTSDSTDSSVASGIAVITDPTCLR